MGYIRIYYPLLTFNSATSNHLKERCTRAICYHYQPTEFIIAGWKCISKNTSKYRPSLALLMITQVTAIHRFRSLTTAWYSLPASGLTSWRWRSLCNALPRVFGRQNKIIFLWFCKLRKWCRWASVYFLTHTLQNISTHLQLIIDLIIIYTILYTINITLISILCCGYSIA